MGYLANFIVYTLAMAGVIGLALFVFKYTTGVKVHHSGKSHSLKVTETLSLTPRKTLYVVEAGAERFLIAGDSERTALISKLETNHEHAMNLEKIKHEITEDYTDKYGLGINSTQKTPYSSLIMAQAEKMGSFR